MMEPKRKKSIELMKSVGLVATVVSDKEIEMSLVGSGGEPIDTILNDDGYLAMYGLGWTRCMETLAKERR